MHTGWVISLFSLLALLGLSAIDPIGIAAMPILLLQKHPFKRSFTFLGGSFVSLMLMGLLLAKGFGAVILRFDTSHSWLVPYIEATAGIVLLCIGGTQLWRLKKGSLSLDPPDAIVRRLRLGNIQLFIAGALLVVVQSMIDVVFVIAMIRVGQLRLHLAILTLSVATYTIAALSLQLAVVLAYWLSPSKQRTMTLNKVHRLLVKYANQALIGMSFLLGCALLILAVK